MKISSLLRTATLLTVLIVTTFSAAAYDFVVDGIYYNKDSNNATVTYKGNSYLDGDSYSGDIVIPQNVTYKGVTYSVTKIGEYAFYKCSQLKSISIPQSINYIGVNAFEFCSTSFKGVYITDIASWCNIAFAVTLYMGDIFSNPLIYAHNLYLNGELVTNLIIPEGVKSIGSRAFVGCESIQNVVLPSSLETVGGCAFHGCTNIMYVKISNLSAWCNLRLSYERYMPNNTEEYTSNPLYYGAKLLLNNKRITDLIIPDDVTVFKDQNFIKQSFNTVVLHKNIPKTNRAISIQYLNTQKLFTESQSDITFNSNIGELWNFPQNKRYTHNGNYAKIDSIFFPKKITLTTIQLGTLDDFVLNSIQVDGNDVSINNSSLLLTNLSPQTYYNISAKGRISGIDHLFDVKTKERTTSVIKDGISLINSTQTTLDVSFTLNRESGLFPEGKGVDDYYSIFSYNGEIKDFTSDSFVIECKLAGLSPNTSYSLEPWVIYDGVKYYGDFASFTTKSISTNFKGTLGPTSINYTGSYNAGDANVKDAYFLFNGGPQKSKVLNVTGLEPNAMYSYSYTIETSNGNQSNGYSFRTPALSMVTQTARMLTNTMAMLMAETNMADEETSCGFEWRRYDAPEEMPSTKVYCPVYDGTMAGTLKNLSENVYYKYRPFYKSSAGNEYYGDWIAFITADAGVQFDPVVYTYYSPAVTQTDATLQGVALRGSDEITEQGFEYWKKGSNMLMAGSNNVTRVTASGERMSKTVTGLQAGTAYTFRAYVKAGGKTTYGREVDFVTVSGGMDVNADGTVNIADVNLIINYILSGKYGNQGDVNGDGAINITDVNLIINEILSH